MMEAHLPSKPIRQRYFTPISMCGCIHACTPPPQPVFPILLHIDLLEFMLERLTQLRLTLCPLFAREKVQSSPYASAPRDLLVGTMLLALLFSGLCHLQR